MSPLEMMIKRFVYKSFLINIKVSWVENLHLFEERDRASTQPIPRKNKIRLSSIQTQLSHDQLWQPQIKFWKISKF